MTLVRSREYERNETILDVTVIVHFEYSYSFIRSIWQKKKVSIRNSMSNSKLFRNLTCIPCCFGFMLSKRKIIICFKSSIDIVTLINFPCICYDLNRNLE